MTVVQIGEAMLNAVGTSACVSAYGTDDPYWVGRYALDFGDINPDGTLN